jgi:hypothetical protein
MDQIPAIADRAAFQAELVLRIRLRRADCAHPQGRTGGRHVGLAQHLAGRQRPPPSPDPVCQRDGMAYDRAFPLPPRRITKTIHGVHTATLLRSSRA